MPWRLGIDLGTNSLGWWAFAVEKEGSRWRVSDSLDGGVYIFSDGREPAKNGRVGDSNAVERRNARSMRRNRDRHKTRLHAFMHELVELGLMPKSPDERDKLFQTRKGEDSDRSNPYRLRAEAVEQPLAPYELGRALFHLGLRRGFKSNRLEQTDDDGGKLKKRIDELNSALNGKTLGQFQWACLQAERERQDSGEKPAGIRFRGEGEFYPDRTMYATEFDKIRKKQESHYSLKSDDWERLRDRYVLFQWPLKPVERGSCEFFVREQRHWRDTPIGHDFRIYQELNMLRWVDADYQEHCLSEEQRSAVLQLLLTRKSEVKFDSLRKQKYQGTPLFPDCVRFNLESEKRKGLKNHAIGATLAENPQLSYLWQRRCSDEGDAGLLDDIFEALHEENDTDSLDSRLTEMGLDAKAVQELILWPRLSRVTASVSRRFMEAIVPIMRDQKLLYSEAASRVKDRNRAPLRPSQQPEGRHHDTLPYYGEVLHGSTLGANPAADPQTAPEQHFGKINNPTVHVALNSLRRVVNTLIERFGEQPVEIHVELSRDLKRTRKERDEDTKQQAHNQKENTRIREELTRHGLTQPSARDIKKYKLWEELGKDTLARCCPFSGKVISCVQLLNGEAEIEHILPFKRTLDDSMANLTVAMRWANRRKGNETPYEAFASNAHAAHGIEWEGVRARADRLPANKKWRFGPDAMARFEGEKDFIARQLTDNAYIARAAMRYLNCLKGVEQIVPNRGGLTALLRGKWDFNRILSYTNRKSREDHRHHAVDAAVVGLADRAILNNVSKQTARGADDRVHIVVPTLPEPIAHAIRTRIPEIVVAFKPDHGWQGAMFKDSAYGFIPPERRDPDLPDHNLVVRKSLAELTLKECGFVRDKKDKRLRYVGGCSCDKRLRSSVGVYLTQAAENGEDLAKPTELKKVLARFGAEHGIGRVRILVADQTVKPIPSAPYKGYKPDSYVCCDIWRCPKGKAGKWQHERYEWRGVYWAYADTPNGVPVPQTRKPHPAAKLVARLYKNDLVAYEEDGQTRVMRVAGFHTTRNKLFVSPHFVADPKPKDVSINTLGSRGLRKLWVSPDGRIKGITR